jgi:hypothetical protein
MIPDTIADAIALMGWDVTNTLEIPIARIGPTGNAIHSTVRDGSHQRLADFPDDLYAVAAFYKPGTISARGGRRKENVERVLELPFDIDLKDFLGLPKEAIHAMPQEEVDEHIAALAKEARRVFELAAIPIHRVRYSGYGIYVDVRITDEDQQRVEDIAHIHKELVERINILADCVLVDPGACDAPTRLTRLVGSVNRKGTIPRVAAILFETDGAVRLDQLNVEPASESTHPSPDSVDELRLGDDAVNEIVAIIASHYVEGQRNSINHLTPTMLLKRGVGPDQVEAIFERVTADDENPSKSMDDVRRTCFRWELGKPISGYRGLERVLGDKHPMITGLTRVLNRCQAAVRRVEAQVLSRAIPVPDFPLHVLPTPVQRYVTAAAACTAVPVEMVAGPFLAYTGGLIGNRLALRMKPTWSAFPGLVVAVVAPPGSAKTPALNAASEPLRKLQTRAGVAYHERVAKYEQAMAQWKSTGKANGDPRPNEPKPLRHYRTTDITVEGLAVLLEQFPGIVVDRDELSGWVGALDRYANGKGSDKQFYLSLYSNTEIKVDRKSSPTIYCPSPVASIVGGIQPDLVTTLHSPDGKRDGFVERILPIVPDCAPAPWSWETGLSHEVLQGVLGLYTKLDYLPYVDLGAEDRRIEVALSPEVKVIWEAWYNQNHLEWIPDAAPLAAGFYSKLETYVPRFALILHALHHPPTPFDAPNRTLNRVLSAEQMLGAIDLAEFFRAHIHRFIALLGSNAALPANGLWGRIGRALHREGANADGGWVMRSRLSRCLGNGVDAEELTDTLNELREAGKVERRFCPSRTKPREEWRLAFVGS